jgi:hypothetical protein
MRHIRGNPTTRSRERAWQLMMLAVNTVCPSEALENYLEYFLR